MVFAQELDRARYPIKTRLWGIAIGSVLMASIAVALASPRTIAFTLTAILLALLVSHRARNGSADELQRVLRQALPAIAFVGFALLSALWAAEPRASLIAAATAAGWLAVAVFGSAAVLGEPRRNQFHMAEGLWVGLIAGLVYLFIEILTHQSIKMYLYNALSIPKHWLRPAAAFTWKGDVLVAIAPYDLTRSVAPITLLLWSSLLSLRVTAPGNRAGLWSGLLYALAVVTIMVSEHETSKVAIIVSTLVFLLSRLSATGAAWLLRIAWVGACLAVVPVALAMYRADLHNAPWVQKTAQHRIVIWNNTAEHSLDSPVIGIGAGMMYQLDEKGQIVAKQKVEKFAANARHAHNVYLQTWFEFGAIGAGLLALLGLGLIETIQRLRREFRPYAHATVGAAMSLAAASYGLWQPWFLAMFALSVICLVLAARVNDRH